MKWPFCFSSYLFMYLLLIYPRFNRRRISWWPVHGEDHTAAGHGRIVSAPPLLWCVGRRGMIHLEQRLSACLPFVSGAAQWRNHFSEKSLNKTERSNWRDLRCSGASISCISTVQLIFDFSDSVFSLLRRLSQNLHFTRSSNSVLGLFRPEKIIELNVTPQRIAL